MFDVGWSELLVIGVVAVVVVGPKDLPRVLRGAAQMMRKARSLTDELKAGVHDLIEEAEIQEVKKSIHHVSNFDPRKRLEAYIDPTTGSYVPPSPEGDAPDSDAPDAGRDAKGRGPASRESLAATAPTEDKALKDKPEAPAASAPADAATHDENGKPER